MGSFAGARGGRYGEDELCEVEQYNRKYISDIVVADGLVREHDTHGPAKAYAVADKQCELGHKRLGAM